MRRRSIVLLAGGLLALALAPPVFGAGESTTPSPDQSASTTTTAPYDSDSTATTATTAPSSTTTTPSGAGATTTTTAPDQATDSPAPSGNCSEPVQTHEAAPAEGESVIYPAGDAGEVEVSRLSATELEIIEAVANDGWTSEVTAPSGPRVKARFVETASSNKTRFAAQMDQAGEEIHVRVESCA
jgi:Predicted solute binding protein